MLKLLPLLQSASLRLTLLSLCAALAGCVSGADPTAMVPESVRLARKSSRSVSVAVTGGQKTNPLWTSQVSNEDFATALQTSIEKYGLFSSVIRGGGGHYLLDVRLVRLQQPMLGFNMTVQAEVEWRLKDGSGRVVWTETTNRPYTATVGDAFVGATRLKLANEGAIRENIKTGLERMSTVSL